jgi:molybdate transport system ATP-binding protein
MLEVDIEKQVGDFSLRVAFQVGQEILVLFGPSGAGKSMILNCIAGLAHPDRGFIRLENRLFFETSRLCFSGLRPLSSLDRYPEPGLRHPKAA